MDKSGQKKLTDSHQGRSQIIFLLIFYVPRPEAWIPRKNFNRVICLPGVQGDSRDNRPRQQFGMRFKLSAGFGIRQLGFKYT